MTRVFAMHRVVGAISTLATLAIVASLLTGVGASPASAGAGFQKPKAGQCRNISYSQSRAATNSTAPVSCGTKHTAQTIAVGTLSKKVWKSKKKASAAIDSLCQKAFNKSVGRSTSLRLRSSFAVSSFVPTKAQKRKGALWYRCDAVVLRGKALTPLTTTKKPLLSSPTPANQARCITSSTATPTTCDAPHKYKATSAFRLKGKKYPGKSDVTKDAKSGCNSRVTTSSFKYDAPSKADWSDGLKYVVCYSAHTLPPAPPPFDPGKPTSTMVVPTGSVPFGTDVTVTGIATDDDAVVSPLSATVRNSAGLYLQDNGALNATVNTYPVSIASGAYGTASVGWSMLFDDNLPIGTYTVALTVKDSVNKTAVVSKSFGVSSAADTAKPVATITGPGTSIFTTTNFVINGTVTDNVGVETISVRLTNAAGNFLQDNLTSFTSTPNDLNVTIGGLHTSSTDFSIDTGDRTAGAYTVIVNATDAAGNAATQKTKAVTVTMSTGSNEVIYEMNEASGATVMTDSSDNNLDAPIDQSGLDTGNSYMGATGYLWQFTSPTALPVKPQRVIKVPDNAKLDAGNDTFTIEIRYQTTNSFGNVIQKGQSGGAQWKIQQPGGLPSCLFKSSAGTSQQIAVQSTIDFRGSAWHTLKCVRSGNNVTMYVDGIYNGQKNAAAGVTIGNIDNNNVLSIGGKATCDQVEVTCDYYSGRIDYVKLTHG